MGFKRFVKAAVKKRPGLLGIFPGGAALGMAAEIRKGLKRKLGSRGISSADTGIGAEEAPKIRDVTRGAGEGVTRFRSSKTGGIF